MTLFRTVEPAVEPVTLTEAKLHLRIDHSSEDDLIKALIRAARDEVERQTSLALIEQDWRLAIDHAPANGTIFLRRGPIRELISITMYGADGEAAIVDPETYQLDDLSTPARLFLRERPPRLRAMNGIEIDFRAGFGEAGTDVPDLLRRAILMLVAHWFEFRAGFGAEAQPVSMPGGFSRLISSYCPRRLA